LVHYYSFGFYLNIKEKGNNTCIINFYSLISGDIDTSNQSVAVFKSQKISSSSKVCNHSTEHDLWCF